MTSLFDIESDPPWLIARFGRPQNMAGWALNRPGLTEADTVAWLQVVNADLPLGVDPLDLLERRLAARSLSGAVGLMTARDVSRFHGAVAHGEDGETAQALITLGLTNGAGLDGQGRLSPAYVPEPVGTINLLVAVSCPLSEGARIEALSIAAAARTAALLADGGRVFGTGTDCIVVACPVAAAAQDYAGLHTAIGRAVTAAVYRATAEARRGWEADYAGFDFSTAVP